MNNDSTMDNQTKGEAVAATLNSDLAGLFPIPRSSAEAYGDSMATMVVAVDHAMMQHPRISEFLGGCPINVMRKNHKNHARFMHTVFTLNSPQMLGNALPWVYRSYSARGFSHDYFPAELSAWQETVKEHLDVDSARHILDIYRAMQSHHDRIIELSRMTPVDLFRPRTWSADLEELLSHLFKGSWEKAAQILTSNLEEGPKCTHSYQRGVEAVMYRTGALWEEGKISVAQEHLATSTMDRVMAYSYEKHLTKKPTMGKAIVACPEDEQHELGGRLVADILETNGWDCTFLGANVPIAELANIAMQFSPDIICLSVTIPYHLSNVQKTIDTVRKQEGLEDVKIMVGGLAFEVAPPTIEQLGADGFSRDARGAVELASEWWEELRAE